MEISYTVIGIPRPQSRPRVFFNKGRTIAYSPKTDWFNIVYTRTLEEKLKRKLKLSGALEVILIFCLPIPKSISKKKRAELHYITKKPDLDNLSKAVMDAINNTGIWEDDSQIAHLDVSKIYSEEPRCLITIREVE